MSKKTTQTAKAPDPVQRIWEKVHSGKIALEEVRAFVDKVYKEEVAQRKSESREINELRQLAEKDHRIFETLAANIPDTNVFVFDTSLKVTLVYGKEMENFGYSSNHFIGRHITEIWEEESSVGLSGVYADAVKGKKGKAEFAISGDHYLIHAIPIRDDSGKVYAAMAVMTNVSEEKKRENELQNAWIRAEGANRAKSEFMANMSHEIRTPLNSIIGFTEQLSGSKLNGEQQKFTDLIEESSEHLLSIVNEILILLKLGAGSVSLEEIPFHVRNVYGSVYNTFRIRAQKKRVHLEFQVAKEVPEVLVGDPIRFKQILINLVSNSLKFTQFGYVRCSAKISGKENEPVMLQVVVKDTGIGIEKEELDTIFEPFHQSDSSVTRKFGGSGLGLTIVKKLVELQGGSISVTSRKGKGTEFKLHIPYGTGRKEDLPEEERIYTTDRELVKDIRVLLVDDDETNRLLASTILDNWNLVFDVAGDGEEALKYMEKNRYDVVLLDIHMPGISGMDVAGIVRKERGGLNRKTKIIAVTANVIKSDVKKYTDAGMDSYLIKPYREEALFNKICNVLKLKTNAIPDSQIMEGKTKLEGEKSWKKQYDLNDLINIARGDIPFYNKTLKSYVHTAEDMIGKIGEQLEREQWLEVGELAHKIISSSRFLGLSEIANLCIRIEDNTLRNNNYKDVPGMVEELVQKLNNILPQLKNEYIGKKS
ncbi:MAG: ATP-binding protein [Bacteroidales bacterium]